MFYRLCTDSDVTHCDLEEDIMFLIRENIATISSHQLAFRNFPWKDDLSCHKVNIFDIGEILLENHSLNHKVILFFLKKTSVGTIPSMLIHFYRLEAFKICYSFGGHGHGREGTLSMINLGDLIGP